MPDILLAFLLFAGAALVAKPWLSPQEWRQQHGTKHLTRLEKRRAKARAAWLKEHHATLSTEQRQWIQDNPDWLEGR